MQYIKIDNNTWVEVDQGTNTTRLIRKSDIEQQLEESQALLIATPNDEELLAWARENHPYRTQTQAVQMTIDACTELLIKLV
jgi:hypothetical protein